MGRQTLIASTASAVTDRELNAQSYEWVLLGCGGLATTETVTAKVDGKALPSPQQLTASVPLIKLDGGLVYQVDKASTAAPATVFFVPGPPINPVA